MKISVAMTTYNGEAYIEEQMLSLFTQTRKADEIIICDDCSSDDTVRILKDIIQKHHAEYCRLIINETNLGYRKNFKKSIEMTSGDIIFLCDQDDIWESDKLEKIEKIFKENPKALSVNTAFHLIDGQGQQISYEDKKGFCNHGFIKGSFEKNQPQKVSYEMLLRYNISPGCTMAFRESIKKAFIKYTQSILPHDWEINLLAGMRNGCYFLNTPMIQYRIHGKNTLGMNTNDHISVLQFEQDIDFRIKSIKEKIALISIVEEWHHRWRISPKQRKEFEKIKKYDRLRAYVVCQHKLRACIPLMLMTLKLWDGKYVRFKTTFGDIFYAVRRKNSTWEEF